MKTSRVLTVLALFAATSSSFAQDSRTQPGSTKTNTSTTSTSNTSGGGGINFLNLLDSFMNNAGSGIAGSGPQLSENCQKVMKANSEPDPAECGKIVDLELDLKEQPKCDEFQVSGKFTAEGFEKVSKKYVALEEYLAGCAVPMLARTKGMFGCVMEFDNLVNQFIQTQQPKLLSLMDDINKRADELVAREKEMKKQQTAIGSFQNELDKLTSEVNAAADNAAMTLAEVQPIADELAKFPEQLKAQEPAVILKRALDCFEKDPGGANGDANFLCKANDAKIVSAADLIACRFGYRETLDPSGRQYVQKSGGVNHTEAKEKALTERARNEIGSAIQNIYEIADIVSPSAANLGGKVTSLKKVQENLRRIGLVSSAKGSKYPGSMSVGAKAAEEFTKCYNREANEYLAEKKQTGSSWNKEVSNYQKRMNAEVIGKIEAMAKKSDEVYQKIFEKFNRQVVFVGSGAPHTLVSLKPKSYCKSYVSENNRASMQPHELGMPGVGDPKSQFECAKRNYQDVLEGLTNRSGFVLTKTFPIDVRGLRFKDHFLKVDCHGLSDCKALVQHAKEQADAKVEAYDTSKDTFFKGDRNTGWDGAKNIVDNALKAIATGQDRRGNQVGMGVSYLSAGLFQAEAAIRKNIGRFITDKSKADFTFDKVAAKTMKTKSIDGNTIYDTPGADFDLKGVLAGISPMVDVRGPGMAKANAALATAMNETTVKLAQVRAITGSKIDENGKVTKGDMKVLKDAYARCVKEGVIDKVREELAAIDTGVRNCGWYNEYCDENKKEKISQLIEDVNKVLVEAGSGLPSIEADCNIDGILDLGVNEGCKDESAARKNVKEEIEKQFKADNLIVKVPTDYKSKVVDRTCCKALKSKVTSDTTLNSMLSGMFIDANCTDAAGNEAGTGQVKETDQSDNIVNNEDGTPKMREANLTQNVNQACSDRVDEVLGLIKTKMELPEKTKCQAIVRELEKAKIRISGNKGLGGSSSTGANP